MRYADISCTDIVWEPEVLRELRGQLHGIERDLDIDVAQPHLLSRFYLDGGEGLAGCEVHLGRVLEMTGRVATIKYQSLLIVLFLYCEHPDAAFTFRRVLDKSCSM